MEEHHTKDGDEPEAIHFCHVAVGRGGDPPEAGEVPSLTGLSIARFNSALHEGAVRGIGIFNGILRFRRRQDFANHNLHALNYFGPRFSSFKNDDFHDNIMGRGCQPKRVVFHFAHGMAKSTVPGALARYIALGHFQITAAFPAFEIWMAQTSN
jgi:hypothetical protein